MGGCASIDTRPSGSSSSSMSSDISVQPPQARPMFSTSSGSGGANTIGGGRGSATNTTPPNNINTNYPLLLPSTPSLGGSNALRRANHPRLTIAPISTPSTRSGDGRIIPLLNGYKHSAPSAIDPTQAQKFLDAELLRLSCPHTPTGEGMTEFPYYCPICFLHFREIYQTSCCKNTICLICALDHIKARATDTMMVANWIALPCDEESTTVTGDASITTTSSTTTTASIEGVSCPCCNLDSVRFSKVNARDSGHIRSYQDSPHTRALVKDMEMRQMMMLAPIGGTSATNGTSSTSISIHKPIRPSSRSQVNNLHSLPARSASVILPRSSTGAASRGGVGGGVSHHGESTAVVNQFPLPPHHPSAHHPHHLAATSSAISAADRVVTHPHQHVDFSASPSLHSHTNQPADSPRDDELSSTQNSTLLDMYTARRTSMPSGVGLQPGKSASPSLDAQAGGGSGDGVYHASGEIEYEEDAMRTQRNARRSDGAEVVAAAAASAILASSSSSSASVAPSSTLATAQAAPAPTISSYPSNSSSNGGGGGEDVVLGWSSGGGNRAPVSAATTTTSSSLPPRPNIPSATIPSTSSSTRPPQPQSSLSSTAATTAPRPPTLRASGGSDASGQTSANPLTPLPDGGSMVKRPDSAPMRRETSGGEIVNTTTSTAAVFNGANASPSIDTHRVATPTRGHQILPFQPSPSLSPTSSSQQQQQQRPFHSSHGWISSSSPAAAASSSVCGTDDTRLTNHSSNGERKEDYVVDIRHGSAGAGTTRVVVASSSSSSSQKNRSSNNDNGDQEERKCGVSNGSDAFAALFHARDSCDINDAEAAELEAELNAEAEAEAEAARENGGVGGGRHTIEASCTYTRVESSIFLMDGDGVRTPDNELRTMNKEEAAAMMSLSKLALTGGGQMNMTSTHGTAPITSATPPLVEESFCYEQSVVSLAGINQDFTSPHHQQKKAHSNSSAAQINAYQLTPVETMVPTTTD